MKNILKLFLSVALVAGAFAACTPDKKELKLSADKESIEADGVDKVKFTVLYDGQEVTGAVIKSGDTTLEGDSFTTTEAGVHKFTASYDGAVSNEISVTASEAVSKLVLKADKLEIKADGKDKVKFTVTFNGADVTDKSSICELDEMCLGTPFFSTTTEGEHKFSAKYKPADKEMESNIVVITAVKVIPKLVLSADKLEIPDNGTAEVHFTVKLDNKTDVTADAKIYGPDGKLLPTPVFKPSAVGKFEFYALYDCGSAVPEDVIKSKTVVINVVEPKLVLTADKYAIAFDGTEEARLTATFGGEDVTAAAKLIGPDGNPMSAPVFKSSTAGEYKFHATYDFTRRGQTESATSEEITVYVADPRFIQAKNVAFFTYTATWCGPCYGFKSIMKNIVASYGDHMVQVNLHTSTSPKDAIGATTALIGTMKQIEADGRFRLGGWPSCIMELREDPAKPGYIPAESDVRKAYNVYIKNAPKSAILVNSTITDNKVNVAVTIAALGADDYSLGIFLVEDHITAYQAGHGANYDHTNVAREIGSNIMGDSVGTMTPGQTIEKSFSFDIKDGFKTENLSLVVYTTRKEGKYFVIDNSRKVPVSGAAEF